MVLHPLKADGLLALVTLRRGGGFLRAQQFGADHRVGADGRAAVALYALGSVPGRDLDSDAPLFPAGVALLPAAVLVAVEGADRQVVALLAAHFEEDLLEELRRSGPAGVGGVLGGSPALGHGNLPDLPHALVDGGAVHVHDVLSLGAVGLADLRFQVGDGLLHREDLGEGKEARLHYHVDAAAKA